MEANMVIHHKCLRNISPLSWAHRKVYLAREYAKYARNRVNASEIVESYEKELVTQIRAAEDMLKRKHRPLRSSVSGRFL